MTNNVITEIMNSKKAKKVKQSNVEVYTEWAPAA